MQPAIVLDTFFQPDKGSDFYSTFLLSPNAATLSPPDSGSNSSNPHSPPSSLDVDHPTTFAFMARQGSSSLSHPTSQPPATAFTPSIPYFEQLPAVAHTAHATPKPQSFNGSYDYQIQSHPSLYSSWTGYEPMSWIPQSTIDHPVDFTVPSQPEQPPPSITYKRRRVSIQDASAQPVLQQAQRPYNHNPTTQTQPTPSVEPAAPINLVHANAPSIREAFTSASNTGKPAKKRTLTDRGQGQASDENPDGVSEPTGHNAVEKRYRTKINSSLTTLQNLIPALSHLKESETNASGGSGNKRTSAFILSAPQPTSFPAGTKIDGVEPPSKLSKGVIIDKGIEYIQVLKQDRASLEQRLLLAEQILDTIPSARAKYDQRISQESAPPIATAPVVQTRRALYAVFAGVSLLSTASAGMDWYPDQARSSVWTNASSFLLRAGDQSNFKSMPTIGMVALAGWAVVALYYLLSTGASLVHKAFAADDRENRHRREQALRILAIYDQSDPSPSQPDKVFSDMVKVRKALLVLSGAGDLGAPSIMLSLAWEAVTSYLITVGWSPRVQRTLSQLDTVERCRSLLRLAEIESAYGVFHVASCYPAQPNAGDKMCGRSSRLCTFLKLHNLARVIHWGNDDVSSVLSRSRINASLSLCLVSIFSSLASPLSRRRRLWNVAILKPKREQAHQLEPWIAMALSQDYEDACRSAFTAWPGLSSPSDSLPLLRVSEAACCKVLLRAWSQLFTMLIETSLADLAPTAHIKLESKNPDASVDLGIEIDQALNATIPASPAHTLALLTKGFWSMGMGDMGEARHYAFILLSEHKQRGPASLLSGPQAFIQLLLPSTLEIKVEQIQVPTQPIDVMAFTCLRWLDLRRQCSILPSDTTSRALYQSTLSLRQLFNDPVWQNTDLPAAQALCIQMAELCGRKAAGMA